MKTQIPYAVLSAEIKHDNGWYQLLPAGEFRARDGRPFDAPFWYLDGEIAARLIEQVRSSGQDVLIDYDHQTLLKAKQGLGEALAAGRFSADEIEWREDSGLWIKPRLTPKAQQHVADSEYLYLSAVFPYDGNGIPLELRMAALTNDPGITGMQSIATLAAEFYDSQSQPTPKTIPKTKESPMTEQLRQLLAKLGVTVEKDATLSDEQGVAALSALDTLLSDKQTADEKVATLSAQANTVDLSRYVPKATYDATVQQLAVLSAQTSDTEIDTTITKARNEGRVIEAEVDYLKGFGKQQGVAALSAMLDARPQIAVLSAKQTDTTKPADGEKLAVLSADEKTAAKLLGLSEDEFIKQKDAE
ncbi:phage protease [Testudinibacter sp. P27/CKL/0425]